MLLWETGRPLARAQDEVRLFSPSGRRRAKRKEPSSSEAPLCGMTLALVLGCPYAPIRGFPGGSEVKESACNAGDPGSIPELGRSPGEANGNQLLYSPLQGPFRVGTGESGLVLCGGMELRLNLAV